MRTSLLLICATSLVVEFGTVVLAQNQTCPDKAIGTCISYIVEPISGSSIVDQQISQVCSRLQELTTCLPKNGCPADKTVTLQVKNAIQSGLSKLCSANRDSLVKSAGCWKGAGTANKINSCNSTFIANLQSGTTFCDAGGSYLTCVQTAVLADCGPESMIYYTTYTHSILIGYAIAKNCQIWDNKCLPWNITSCLSNINTETTWVILGKNTLKNNLDQICRRGDGVSTCLKSQSCSSSNTFYQLINSKVDTGYSSVCQERDRTSSYDSFADCWTKDSVKSGLTACNNTLQASLNTSASYCSSVNAFLQCSQDLVTRECSIDSGRAMAAYFYFLYSISATVKDCTLDQKFAPTSSGSTASVSSSKPSSPSSSMSTLNSGSTYRSASLTASATTNNHGGLIETTTSDASRDRMTSYVHMLLAAIMLSHLALA